jgi:ubiquinone biosynthesis protein Coq4
MATIKSALDKTNSAQAETPKPQTQEFPEQGTKPVDYAPKDDHPINKIKVDNRSDHDVSHADTSSDNDSGGEVASDVTETQPM